MSGRFTYGEREPRGRRRRGGQAAGHVFCFSPARSLPVRACLSSAHCVLAPTRPA